MYPICGIVSSLIGKKIEDMSPLLVIEVCFMHDIAKAFSPSWKALFSPWNWSWTTQKTSAPSLFMVPFLLIAMPRMPHHLIKIKPKSFPSLALLIHLYTRQRPTLPKNIPAVINSLIPWKTILTVCQLFFQGPIPSQIMMPAPLWEGLHPHPLFCCSRQNHRRIIIVRNAFYVLEINSPIYSLLNYHHQPSCIFFSYWYSNPFPFYPTSYFKSMTLMTTSSVTSPLAQNNVALYRILSLGSINLQLYPVLLHLLQLEFLQMIWWWLHQISLICHPFIITLTSC